MFCYIIMPDSIEIKKFEFIKNSKKYIFYKTGNNKIKKINRFKQFYSYDLEGAKGVLIGKIKQDIRNTDKILKDYWCKLELINNLTEKDCE
jgi:hypothetical protein